MSLFIAWLLTVVSVTSDRHLLLYVQGHMLLFLAWLLTVVSVTSDRHLLLCVQGHMPKQDLLRKYDLLQFADVTRAVSWVFLLFLSLNFSLRRNSSQEISKHAFSVIHAALLIVGLRISVCLKESVLHLLWHVKPFNINHSISMLLDSAFLDQSVHESIGTQSRSDQSMHKRIYTQSKLCFIAWKHAWKSIHTHKANWI